MNRFEDSISFVRPNGGCEFGTFNDREDDKYPKGAFRSEKRISGNTSEMDVFFCGENVYVIDETIKKEDIAVIAGIFKSKGEAKKNGWKGDLEKGLKIYTAGKLKKIICTYT